MAKKLFFSGIFFFWAVWGAAGGGAEERADANRHSPAAEASPDSEAWSEIQHNAGMHGTGSEYVTMRPGDARLALSPAIPYIDTFLGPIADHLESVDVQRVEGGVSVALNLDEKVFFPISSPLSSGGEKKSQKGDLYGIQVGRRVSLVFHNSAYKVQLRKIEGIVARIRLPVVSGMPGLSDRVKLRWIEIDARRQLLKFQAVAVNDLLRFTASVDLKDHQFSGINIWETLALNGPAVLALLRFMAL